MGEYAYYEELTVVCLLGASLVYNAALSWRRANLKDIP